MAHHLQGQKDNAMPKFIMLIINIWFVLFVGSGWAQPYVSKDPLYLDGQRGLMSFIDNRLTIVQNSSRTTRKAPGLCPNRGNMPPSLRRFTSASAGLRHNRPQPLDRSIEQQPTKKPS